MVYFSSVKLSFLDIVSLKLWYLLLLCSSTNVQTHTDIPLAAICIKLDTGMKKVPCELVVALLSSPAP